MAVILCFTRLETIILCSPPLLWQTARASAEMISNRFSKMLSTRLPPYIISFQWAENKNLIHKSIATSIRCTLVHILFCSIKILYCLYPLCSILHRWACCRKVAYLGFNRSQETFSLMRGESCEWNINDNVKCAESSPDTALLAVAPLQAPEMPAKLRGEWSRARRGWNHPFGHCPRWNHFPPCFFLWSHSEQLKLFLPKGQGAILSVKLDPLNRELR